MIEEISDKEADIFEDQATVAFPLQPGKFTHPKKRPYRPRRSTSHPCSHSGQLGYSAPHEHVFAPLVSCSLCRLLPHAAQSTVHDQHVNGHCEIVVNHGSGFRWLGEAKVHKDYGWLADGFLQFSTRYGTALVGKDHGELIIHHRGGASATVLDEWKTRLTSAHDMVSLTEDKITTELFFPTQQERANSGCVFYVRHSAVPLQNDPKK